MKDFKYDVFISYNSTDYEIAKDVYGFLKENDLEVFFYDKVKDIDYSHYSKEIGNALRDSARMIVVCSNADFVRDDRGGASKWVYFEWSTFHQMILDNKKPDGADLITIYTNTTNLEDLPLRLSKKCILYDNFKDCIIGCLGNSIQAVDNSKDVVDTELWKLKEKYDVFISYSRNDYSDSFQNVIQGNVISVLKEAFDDARITYWFDYERIKAGDKFPEHIADNIGLSRIFLFISSKNSICNSDWTYREIALADEFKKKIIPLRIDDTPLTKNNKISLRMADISPIEYYSNPEKGLKELIETINFYLNKQKDEELIKKIMSDCKKLNQEETEFEGKIVQLLSTVKSISDEHSRKEMETLIKKSSPIQKRIKSEIGEKEGSQTGSVTNDGYNSIWKRLLPILAGLIGLLLGLILFSMIGQCDKPRYPAVVPDSLENKKTLVFAGGGSVATYLNHEYSEDVIKHFSDYFNALGDYSKDSIFTRNFYPNSIYLHMPSGPALSLLVEEAFMPDTQKGQPFYPVCFSAMRANDSTFTTTCTIEQIKNVGVILEYYIGDEYLTVYLEKNDSIEKLAGLSEYKNKDYITVNKLRDLLSKDYYTVYSTSTESGTYKAYVDTIGDKMKYRLDSTKYYSCESDSDLFEQTNKPYMILGGKYYYPKNYAEHIRREDIRVFTLCDEKKNPVTNPLYLYFMAYKDKNHHKVAKEIIDLLIVLGFKDDLENPLFFKYPDKRYYGIYFDKSSGLVHPIKNSSDK